MRLNTMSGNNKKREQIVQLVTKMGKKGESSPFQWSSIQVKSSIKNRNEKSLPESVSKNENEDRLSEVNVTNPSVPITNGVQYQTDFVSIDEEALLLNDIKQRPYIWEGFDQRRRVQRYDLSSNNKRIVDNHNNDDGSLSYTNAVPDYIVSLAKRIEQQFGHRPQHCSIEEYVAENTIRSKGEFASNYTVTTYESTSSSFMYPKVDVGSDDKKNDIMAVLSQCNNTTTPSSSWFVAQIPLKMEAYQHCNKPKQHSANCWTLQSTNHITDIQMEQRSILIKTDDFLLNWRSRTAAIPLDMLTSDVGNKLLQHKEELSTFIIKFHNFPLEDNSNNKEDTVKDKIIDELDNYGYRPSDNDYIPSDDTPIPPLESLLSIIITTSPIRSNPTTELLERAMETFTFGGTDFAYKCRKVIVCDGCRIREEDDEPNELGHRKVTNKHTNVKQAMRNGIVSTDQAENYRQYKERLKQLCTDAAEADVQSPFCNTIVVELDERYGYGFALRHALRYCIETQYVCVVQHDRTFMRPTPIQETVHAMWKHPNIKYVGMSMRSNLLYRDLFLGKYGRMYQHDFDNSIVRLPELVVNADKYGPNSDSTRRMVYDTEKLNVNIQSLAETYRVSAQGEIPQAIDIDKVGTLRNEGKVQLILSPTIFWYDNVHICETAHYRDFIFTPSYKMVARGGFVEDKLSPVIKRTVERLGFAEGHSRFGCYLLDDTSGMFFTGHLDGGSYLTLAAKEEIRATSTTNAKQL